MGLGVLPSDLRVAMELPSNEAVRAAVEAGLGATAISAIFELTTRKSLKTVEPEFSPLEGGAKRDHRFIIPINELSSKRAWA